MDVINTMRDESLPLTVGEFEERGGRPAAQERSTWPAAPDAEAIGRARGEPPHAFLECQRLALAHPGAEDIRRVAGIAQHVDMHPAVAQRRQHALVVQDLRHAVHPGVERGHGQVQPGIDYAWVLGK